MRFSVHEFTQPLQIDLASRAVALRAARANYRDALLKGDLPAAIRAKDIVLQAEVALEMARVLVEGDLR